MPTSPVDTAPRGPPSRHARASEAEGVGAVGEARPLDSRRCNQQRIVEAAAPGRLRPGRARTIGAGARVRLAQRPLPYVAEQIQLSEESRARRRGADGGDVA